MNQKSKKAIAAVSLTAFVTCIGAVGLTACNKGNTQHEHSWKTTYDYNSEGHWIEASCHEGVKQGEAEPHVYDNDGDATCNVCDYVRPMITGMTVTNKTEIENWRGMEDKTVEISLEGDYDVPTALAAGLIKVSSDDNEVLIVKNTNTLHPVSGGKCKVTVTAGTHSVVMDVQVVVPEIILNSTTVSSHADGVAVALPDFTVKDYNGEAVTDPSKIAVTDEDDADAVINIVYDSENACFKGTIATALYTGSAHNILISADDGVTQTPVTANVTGNFYRQLSSYVSAGYTRTNGWTWDTSKQMSTIINTGNFTSRFNIALSEKYYAQASYKFSDIDKIRYLGLMHSYGTFDNDAKWMWTAVGKTGENEYTFYADDQPNNGWSFSEADARMKAKIPASAITDDTCLIQVARSGNDYHCFVNGVYLGVFTSTVYGTGVPTAAGFYTHGGGSNTPIQVTNIDFYSGEKVDQFISENVPEITSVELTNKTALEAWRGDGDISVELTVGGDCTFDEALAYGLVKIVSSNENIVSVNGKVLHRVNEGECTVTISANGITPVTVNLAVRFVGINLSASVINGNADGGNIALPSFYVKNDAGQYVSEGVTVIDKSDPDAKISLTYNADTHSWGGTFGSALYTGAAHTLEVSYTDVNEKEYTAEITANLYRPVLGWTSGKISRDSTWTYDIYAQRIALQSTDNAASRFAMDGSEKCYAQINYKLSDIAKIRYAGLIFHDATRPEGTARWMWAVIKKVENGYRLYVLEFNADLWSFVEDTYYNIKLDVPSDYLDDGDNCLLSCVRDGSSYHFFVNNRYMATLESQYYGSGVPTIPGAYMHSGGNNTKFTADRIDYYSGEKVDDYLGSHAVISFENPQISGRYGEPVSLGITVKCGNESADYTVVDIDDEDAVIDLAAGTIISNKDTGAAHTLLITAKNPTTGSKVYARLTLNLTAATTQ